MENGRMISPMLEMDQAKPPVKEIPHMEFPRVVYKHPLEPTRKIEHRNANHEVVEVEKIQSEHLTRVVADEREMQTALADGWVKEPYLPKPLPDPNARLYASPKK